MGLTDHLPCFIEMLHGHGCIAQVAVRGGTIRVETETLMVSVGGLLVLSLPCQHIGQLIVWPTVSRVSLNESLICPGRFVQFSRYTRVVICRNCEIFSFAGMIA